MYLAFGLLAIAGGFWFYQKARATQTANASVALLDAEEALNAGNLALAQSDLEKLNKRYEGTPASRQGLLLLAQVQYRQGHFEAGMATLQTLINSRDKYVVPGAYNMIGAGQEEQGKPVDAAASYGKAAQVAIYPADRDNYLANAARALTVAGKYDEARQIWTKLSTDESSPVVGEARVRLGELEAKSASKS